jgi:putative membrane protein
MENIDFYDIAKILHIISFVSWFAGLFYLPRLFIYHCKVKKGSEASEIFKVMERKLLRYIMNPAMISTIIFGIYMANVIGFSFIWLHVKLTLVAILIYYHHFLSARRKDFENDNNQFSEKFYRIVNEVPTVILILITFLVIVKPF